MEKVHKNLIQKNFMKLVEEISPQIEDVASMLFNEYDMFTKPMSEEILQENKTPSQKAATLLTLLLTRGPNAFNSLYKTVVTKKLFQAANILMPEIDHWQEPPKYIDQALVLEGPKEDDFKGTYVKIVDFGPEVLSQYEKSLTGDKSSNPNYYVMKHATRGRAVIIDNEHFAKLNQRKGTEKDRRALTLLFEGLGFQVQTYENLKYDEILENLDSEKGLIDSSHDCFVLAILSHGCDGYVFGTDGYSEGGKPQNAVKLTLIKEIFCKVENLVNKPKIFFIQACRGNQEDEGIQISNEQDQDQDAKKTIKEHTAQGSQVESDDFQKIPTYADLFVAMSTTSGNVSYREVTYGSWFIQATVHVLSQYAHQHDLSTLMTMVNEYVSKNKTPKGCKQVSVKEDSFRRLFHFFPGLNEITYKPATK